MENLFYIEFTAALVLDLLLGDPEYPFHPVRLIGKAIAFFENLFRKISGNQKWNGFLFWFFIVFISYFTVFGLIFITRKTVIPLAGSIISVYILYSGLCIGDLAKKVNEIERLLLAGDIQNARKRLSYIVGRDTENLDEKEIVRATVETVAENITDGIVSPVFYALIGGAPLMTAFKAASTLDSMVGYKNEKYRDFGFFSARADDVLNFIPARISAFIIPATSLFAGLHPRRSWKTALRDGRKNPSPNSGISEAAVAGALEIQIGGTNYYGGIKSVKPLIGDKIMELTAEHISKSVRIAVAAGILFFVLGMSMKYLIAVFI